MRCRIEYPALRHPRARRPDLSQSNLLSESGTEATRPRCQRPRGGATSKTAHLNSLRESRIGASNGRTSSVPQRSKAVLNTATPTSPSRVARTSEAPRLRSARARGQRTVELVWRARARAVRCPLLWPCGVPVRRRGRRPTGPQDPIVIGPYGPSVPLSADRPASISSAS